MALTAASEAIASLQPITWHEPRDTYDVVIIGGGGHGLATAYYLAKRHGITDVAVLERGWLGGGNMGRNTTIIRSNYLWDESAAIYEHALKLWEGLSEELDYDLEARHQKVFAMAFRDDADVFVPDVLAHSPQVIVSEWVEGRPLSQVITDGTPTERDEAAGLYLEFLLRGPNRARLLHADLHLGKADSKTP